MLSEHPTRAFPDAQLGVTPRSTALTALMTQHALSFPPKPPEGHGRGRTYDYTDAQFAELHAAASAVTGAERKRLCDDYGIGWSTLQKKVGASTPPPRRRTGGGGTGGGERAAPKRTSIFDQIDALAGNIEDSLDELERERVELQERIDEIDRKKEVLRRIAEVASSEG